MTYKNKLRVYEPTKYVFKTLRDEDSKAQFNVNVAKSNMLHRSKRNFQDSRLHTSSEIVFHTIKDQQGGGISDFIYHSTLV